MTRFNRRYFLKTGLGTLTGGALLGDCRSPYAGKSPAMVFPCPDWTRCQPEAVDMDTATITAARDWALNAAGDEPHGAVIIRHGRLVAEWHHVTPPDKPHPMASVCKSVYCSMLGIALAEKRIRSIDDRLVDYYPELMECTRGFGANDKQFVTDKDRAVTFRQVAAAISGFMEPDQPPGKVFHYQTFGMATMMHAIARQYGFYDARDTQSALGDGELIAQKLRDPIGATWKWRYMNFRFPETAKKEIFMNYPHLLMTTRDMARLGHLWLNEGQWAGRAVIPSAHHRAAVRVPAATKAHVPEKDWKYGYGLWVNEYGRVWPNLPRDSYSAAGAGGRLIWVCPSLGLVIAQNPAVPAKDFFALVAQAQLQERVTAACRT